MKKAIILVLGAVLLSSCGVLKHYQRPDAIKTDGIYGDALTGGGAGLGDLSWREIFTDPQLQALIETGLRDNANMRQADLRIKEAEWSLKAARQAFFPSFSIGANGNLSKVINFQDGYTKTYGIPLTGTWQNFNALNLVNAKRKAKVNVQLMENTKQAIQASLVANIANLYYTLAELDLQLEISRETSENWRRNVEVTRALMEAGESNDAAVASTEANYYAISTSVVDLERSIKEVENTLCALIGTVPGHISRSALDSFKVPAIVETGAEINLLGRRPDVREAELNLATAWYALGQAKANFYPAISLTGQFEYTNSLGSAIVNPGKFIAAGVGSIVMPLFQNGKLRAQYKMSKAELEAAQIAFQQSLLDAGSDVNTAMAAIKAAKGKEQLYAQQVSAQQRAVNATQMLMSNSPTNYLQVLTAQTNLLSAQLSEIGNRYDEIQYTIQLYQALGGGAELPEEK